MVAIWKIKVDNNVHHDHTSYRSYGRCTRRLAVMPTKLNERYKNMALIQVTNTEKQNLIIFIHGFIGGKETWIREDGEKSILDYLKEDKTISSIYDFAVFDYYTEFTDKIDKVKSYVGGLFGKKSSPTKNIDIENIAQMLKTEIKYLDKKIEKIVLIAHSMGGLVAKSMILENIMESNRNKISLYVSLAVPHRGSNLATFGKIIFGNPQLENLQPLGEKINRMNEQWLQLSDKLPKTLYFQAKYDDIVPNIAAISFDNRKVEIDYTDDDHTGIVKPKAENDVLLKALKFHLHSVQSDNFTNSNVIIFDIGKTINPSQYLRNAEIRFTLTNNTNEKIKVTSIELEIIEYRRYNKYENQYTAAPVDEYFLHTTINHDQKQYALTNKQFIIDSGQSDGFFLKVDGEQGYAFEIFLKAEFNRLGFTKRDTINSQKILLEFPLKDIDNIIESL